MADHTTGRIRRTASQWQAIIARFEKSDLSGDTFCQRESLGLATFQRWRGRFATRDESFVEMAVPTQAPTSSTWTVELMLPGEIVLRVRG